MSHSQTILTAALGIAFVYSVMPGEAAAGWQGGGRRDKCVRPQSELTVEQQQSLSAAVRGGNLAASGAGQLDRAATSASTHQLLSQGMYDQAWIRYELCVALDNGHIDQATYNRLLEQSLMGSMSSSPNASTPTFTPTPVSTAPVSTPTPAPSGSTEWINQIREQTQLRSGPNFANMASYGFSLVSTVDPGLLDASTSTTIPLNLPAGYDYAIMGVCDNDCADLDLAVLQGGTELAVDSSQDDWPVVPITPTGGSGYAARVTMYQCSTKNCGYQLSVWGRPAQQAAPVAASAAQHSGSNPVTISSGVQVQGRLGSGDHALPNGEWADRYTISVRAGQTIAAAMASNDIDTYLVALAPSGTSQDNDDCNGDRTSSCLGFVAQESGTWTIYATSYQGNDDGSYGILVEIR